jgi:hypothetical protein
MKTEQKSRHGGARIGAGRKPRLQYEARELFFSAVDARWDMILSKLNKLILRGDFHALRWVLEQRIGRAPQSMDITTQGEKIKAAEVNSERDQRDMEVFSKAAGMLAGLVLKTGMTYEQAEERFERWYGTHPTLASPGRLTWEEATGEKPR